MCKVAVEIVKFANESDEYSLSSLDKVVVLFPEFDKKST